MEFRNRAVSALAVQRGNNRTARLAARVRLIEGLVVIAIARPSVCMASRILRR